MVTAKSPYRKSKYPNTFSDFEGFRAEIVARRKTLIPVKSHFNMTAKALQRIEEGSELRAPMIHKYLSLIGHRGAVGLKRGLKVAWREIPIEKLSDAAILAAKADSLPNRDIARLIGKSQDYFSLQETKPTVELAVKIFQTLGYKVNFRLYNEGLTEEMQKNLEHTRGKLGLKEGQDPKPTVHQLEAQAALDALFLS